MDTLQYTGLDKAQADKMIDMLQKILADLQIFYANVRGFHWHVKGGDFFDVHEQTEKLYMELNQRTDDLAERIAQLGGSPMSRYGDYIEAADIVEVDGVTEGKEIMRMVLETLGKIIPVEREALEAASSAGDAVTAMLLSKILRRQEQHIWMFGAFIDEESEGESGEDSSGESEHSSAGGKRTSGRRQGPHSSRSRE